MTTHDPEIGVRFAIKIGLSDVLIADAFGVSLAYVRRVRDRRATMAVHHIDGDPTNNEIGNLRLVPIKENAR